MSEEKTEGLLDELERLRNLLKEEKSRKDHLNQHIPVLTDVAEHSEKPEETDRQTVAVLSVQGNYQEAPPTLEQVYQGNSPESELNTRLRSQAKLLIQEIIDEELVRVEAQLNRELNHYLEHWLDQMPNHSPD
jgi:SepF-like predicted cell division protein (DUF552 family)